MDQQTALIISLIVEIFVAFIYAQLHQFKVAILVTLAAAGTLITHPLVWWLFKILTTHLGYIERSVLIETGVFSIEALIFKLSSGYCWRISFELALITNFASYFIGIAIYYVISRL